MHCIIRFRLLETLYLVNTAIVIAGPLPPSRRRSLYTLATTMIIISGKAFSIIPLVPVAKATLANKMVCELLIMSTCFKLGLICII